jgi:hypothetical protein
MANQSFVSTFSAGAQDEARRFAWLTAGLLVIWCFASYGWLRPPSLVEDWMGWRQADTQAIARHLADHTSSLFYPRIDWGGRGPGYVESELQLYPALISLFLRVFGEVEWPGQLLSLAFTGGSGWVLYTALRERDGTRAAFVGTLVFLCVPSVLLVSTKVQPEALCVLLFMLSWRSFLRYARSGSPSQLWSYAVFGTLAMLVKPTAAQLGVASFVALWLGHRERLRTWPLWVAWALMLVVFGASLEHGVSIFHQYGNTFGVLAGGDTKMPKLRHLFMLGTYRALIQNNLVWGFGALGSVALLAQLVRRKLQASDWGLLAGMGVWSLISCRYTCVISSGGSHYVVLDSVLAAQCAASLSSAPQLARRLGGWLVPAGAALALAVLALTFRSERRAAVPTPDDRQSIELGRALASVAAPGDLVVVRSVEKGFDDFWGAPLNYEDPRPFYLSHTHGWVLPADEATSARLEREASQGARFYVEPSTEKVLHTLEPWLKRNATLVSRTSSGGRVFSLRGLSRLSG